MKLNKKIFSCVLVAIILCISLVGCGGKSIAGYYVLYDNKEPFSVLEVNNNSFSYRILGYGYLREYSGTVKKTDAEDTYNFFITKDDSVHPWSKVSPFVVTALNDTDLYMDSDASNWNPGTLTKITKQEYKDLIDKDDKAINGPHEAHD